jgi:hypothetical protein
MPYFILSFAILFIKEFIIFNQEIIIYTTFLTLTIIFIYKFKLLNTFEDIQNTIKTLIKVTSLDLQKQDELLKQKANASYIFVKAPTLDLPVDGPCYKSI